MLNQLKDLSLKTKLTLYICRKDSGKMHTIHDGKGFDGDMPEWMVNFVNDANPMLAFEQNGQRKIYFKWSLNAESIAVFLDDAKLSGLTLLLNNLLAQPAPKQGEASNAEIKVLTEKLQQAKLSYEQEKKKTSSAESETAALKKDNAALQEQNTDQAIRLKDALSENLELQRKIKQDEGPVDPSMQMSQARSAITRLKDENSRLFAQIKGWEEKYHKLEEQCNALRAKAGMQPAAVSEPAQQNLPRGLIPIVNALNKIIVTGDASGLNLEALAMITSIPSRGELETSPEAVKSVIAKLLGMEKSGQLTAFQMKKLNSVIGQQ